MIKKESTRTHVVLTAFRHRICPEIAFEKLRCMLNIYCFFGFPKNESHAELIEQETFFVGSMKWHSSGSNSTVHFKKGKCHYAINAMNNKNSTRCANIFQMNESSLLARTRTISVCLSVVCGGIFFEWSICRQLLSNFGSKSSSIVACSEICRSFYGSIE